METRFMAAGLTFRIKETPDLASFRPSGRCAIVPEPTNEHDPLALKVVNEGRVVGYVPGPRSVSPEVQGRIHALIAGGEPYEVAVEEYRYRDGDDWNDLHRGKLGSIKLVLRCADAVESEPDEDANVMASFNEQGVSINFYPDLHQYWCKGQRLKSVTGVLGKCYPPFDAPAIAKRCEKSYGLKAAQIEDLWNTYGNATASFGDAIHGCLEIYQKYHAAGEKALPKHPVLRHAVETFPWNGSLSLPVHAEVLVTAVRRGLCGLADRILVRDGKAWVSDIKVQCEATKKASSHKNRLLPELPNTKVGKAIGQCSIHAAMIAEAGGEVADKVACYVYGETGWDTHVMDRVPDVLDRLGEVL